MYLTERNWIVLAPENHLGKYNNNLRAKKVRIVSWQVPANDCEINKTRKTMFPVLRRQGKDPRGFPDQFSTLRHFVRSQ
jgi:hypothetical protein